MTEMQEKLMVWRAQEDFLLSLTQDQKLALANLLNAKVLLLDDKRVMLHYINTEEDQAQNG